MGAKACDIPVASVRIDGGTQQRPIIAAMVDHYKDLREDGVELPPIAVVHDGTDYWVWDGFHRLEAAKGLGKKTIRASVTPGCLRDAVWLSYSANKAHGMQRPAGTVKRIIENILCDPEWAKTSLTQIAEHVGASRQYVQQVRNDFILKTEGGHDDDEAVETDHPVRNRTGRGKKADHGASYLHHAQGRNCPESLPVRSDQIEVERNGTTYEQMSQEKRVWIEDGDGREIPEHLRATFAVREQFDAFSRECTALKTQVTNAIKANPDAWSRFSDNQFRSDLSRIQQQFKLCGPFIICAYCGGVESKNCQACKGVGFLSRAQARCVPVEMRPAEKGSDK